MSIKNIKLSDAFGSEFHEAVNAVKYIIYGAFVYLKVDLDMMKILSILMLMDTFLGVVKVISLKYQFSFKKLLWGFTTKFLILLIPLIVALIGKGVGKDFLWAVDFTIKILIINEGLSCLTNILSAKNKKNIQNIDLVTVLINYIRKCVVNIALKAFGKSISESVEEITKNKEQ